MKPFKSVSIPVFRRIQQCLFWSALLGLFASIYLLVVYVSGGPIVCGIVSGCDAVRSSVWAYLYGIPRPVFGVIFYLCIIFLMAIRAAWPRWQWVHVDRAILALAIIGVFESGQLTLVELVDIKAFCMWCLTSAVATVLVLISAFFIPRERLNAEESIHMLKRLFVSFAIAFVIGALGLRALWVNGESKKAPLAAPVLTSAQMSVLIPSGIPIEGPATSTVTIVEFLDFQCPSCGEFHLIMKRIREEYAGRIRYVQRMYPLTEIHPFAHEAAIAAVCAGMQQKYFEYADGLMAHQQQLTHEDLLRQADALGLDHEAFVGCLANPAATATVDGDRKQAEQLGIKSTPTTLVNANLIEGVPTYDAVKKVIDAELAR